VALVSHGFWQNHLGGEDDRDRVSFMAFGARYRVEGVMPPGFELLNESDVYLSAERWPGRGDLRRRLVRRDAARREIGIRMALGAAASRLRRDARKAALLPTAAGLPAGTGVDRLAGGFMEALLHEGVPPRDPATFATVVAAFVAAAVVAADLPARRAAKMDPAEILRQE
jgi:hypothetical protein